MAAPEGVATSACAADGILLAHRAFRMDRTRLTTRAPRSWQLTRGQISLGALLVFLAYFVQLVGPIRGLAGLVTSVSAAAAAAERVHELLQEQPTMTAASRPVPLPPATGRVELRNVTFTYPTRQAATLRDVSLTIHPGETVAVIGHSGGEKSTIGKLLLGFYQCDSGKIEIDGVSVAHADPQRVRERFAVVLQETMLLDATVRENLLWAVPDATSQQVNRAVDDSGLASVVATLPQGIDSPVGQRGRQLSGGERQRVAIARAMLRDAPFVILDEPTTGLDPQTAQRVLEPLRRLISGRTALIISHDPATVALAERVVRIDDGTLREVDPAQPDPVGAHPVAADPVEASADMTPSPDTSAKIFSLQERLDRMKA